jgi:hypothetical protein
MRKVKAASLVLDYELYPRNNVDRHNVKGIIDAKHAGVEMPPVVADEATKKVVDGFHRVIAELKENPDGEILVVFKRYRDEAAMFLDAMRYNAAHGARLDPCDRARCTIIAERLAVPLEAVAGALHMPAGKLGDLRNARTATGKDSGLTIPIKNTIGHMAGRALNKRQQEANEKLSGMRQAFYANQLIELIEARLLDTGDEALLERLRRLNDLLTELLVAH